MLLPPRSAASYNVSWSWQGRSRGQGRGETAQHPCHRKPPSWVREALLLPVPWTNLGRGWADYSPKTWNITMPICLCIVYSGLCATMLELVATETAWPAKPKIVTVCLLQKKFTNPNRRWQEMMDDDDDVDSDLIIRRRENGGVGRGRKRKKQKKEKEEERKKIYSLST